MDTPNTLSVTTSVDTKKCALTHNRVIELLALASFVYEFNRRLQTVPDEPFSAMIPRVIRHRPHITAEQRILVDRLLLDAPHTMIHAFVDDMSETDIECGITLDHVRQQVTMVFRGSDSLFDWYTDAQICKTEYRPSVRIHSGFHKLVMSHTFQSLVSMVVALCSHHATHSVHVTGHSLGGALATLCGVMLHEKLARHIEVVVFGCPRIGDYGWKQYVESLCGLHVTRVSNAEDIVTAVPYIGYWHVGTEWVLHPTHTVITKRSDDFAVTCFCRRSIDAHLCQTYIARLLSLQAPVPDVDSSGRAE